MRRACATAAVAEQQIAARGRFNLEMTRLSRLRRLRKLPGCRESEQREHLKRNRETIRVVVI
jgi:predicted transcriptional regulator